MPIIKQRGLQKLLKYILVWKSRVIVSGLCAALHILTVWLMMMSRQCAVYWRSAWKKMLGQKWMHEKHSKYILINWATFHISRNRLYEIIGNGCLDRKCKSNFRHTRLLPGHNGGDKPLQNDSFCKAPWSERHPLRGLLFFWIAMVWADYFTNTANFNFWTEKILKIKNKIYIFIYIHLSPR